MSGIAESGTYREYSVHKQGHDICHTRSHLIIFPFNNIMNVILHQISHYIIPVTNYPYRQLPYTNRKLG